MTMTATKKPTNKAQFIRWMQENNDTEFMFIFSKKFYDEHILISEVKDEPLCRKTINVGTTALTFKGEKFENGEKVPCETKLMYKTTGYQWIFDDRGFTIRTVPYPIRRFIQGAEKIITVQSELRYNYK